MGLRVNYTCHRMGLLALARALQSSAGKLVITASLCHGISWCVMACCRRVPKTVNLSCVVCIRRRINNRASARRVRQKREEDLQKITTLVSPSCSDLDMPVGIFPAQNTAFLHRFPLLTLWQPVSSGLMRHLVLSSTGP